MNKTVLEGITVLGTHDNDHYANDALQWILGAMIPDYQSGFFEKPTPNDTISTKHPKGSITKHKELMENYNKRVKAMNLLIDMFDAIVSNSKHKALQFIEDNKDWI